MTWLELVFTALAGSGGLYVLVAAVLRGIRRAKFRVTFYGGATEAQYSPGESSKLSVGIENRGTSLQRIDQIVVYLPIEATVLGTEYNGLPVTPAINRSEAGLNRERQGVLFGESIVLVPKEADTVGLTLSIPKGTSDRRLTVVVVPKDGRHSVHELRLNPAR